MYAFRNMSKAIYLLSLVAAAVAVPYARSNSNIGADTGSVPSTVDSGESLFQEHNTLLNSTSSGGSGSKYPLNNVGGNDLSGLTIFSRVVLHDSQLSIPAANIFPDSDNSSTSVSSMPDYPSYIPTEDDRVEEAVNKMISVNGHAITKRDISSTPNSSKDLTSTTKEVVYHSDKNEMFQSTEPQPVFLKKAESEVLSHSLPADSSYADAMYIKSIYSAFDLNSAAIGFPYAHDNLITRKKFSSEASKDYDKVTTVTNTERINSNETTESNPILSEIYNDSTFSDDMHLHSVSDETDCPEQLPQYSDTHPIAHSNTDYRTSGSVAEEVHKDTVGIKILHPNSPDAGDSTSAELDNIHGYLQNTSIAKNVSNNISIQSSRSTTSEINTDNFSLKALITMVSLFSGKHQISDDDSNQDSSDSHEVQLQTTGFMNDKTSRSAEVNSGKQTRSISIPEYAESNSTSQYESTESQSMETYSSGDKTDQKIDNSASNSESKASHSIGTSSSDHETEPLIDGSSGSQSESKSSQFIGSSSSGHETGQKIDSSIDSYSETTTSQSMETLSLCYESDKQIDSSVASHFESVESQSLATSYSHETSPQIDSICELYPETATSQLLGAFSSGQETGQNFDSSSASRSENMESQSMGRLSSVHETDQQTESNAASNSESVALQSTETSSSGQETIQKTDSISTSRSENMESQSMGTFSSGHETGQPIDSNSESHSESSLSQSMGTFFSGHETGQPIDSNSESHSESSLSQSMGTFSSGHETGQPIDSNSESHSESPLSQSMGTFFSGIETGQPIDSNSESHSKSMVLQSMGTSSSDHDIGQKIYSRSASNSESMASQPMEKFSSDHKTSQQTMSSFDDPDKTAWTRSRHDRTSYSGGVKSGLPKAQTLYSGSPIQEHLTDFIDRYIPLYFVTQASGYSENPLPKELSHSFRYSNAGSTGGQEFGLSDLPGYMTETSSGQPYYINDGTAASLLIPGTDTRGNYVREEYQISDRRSPVSDLPLYDRQNGYKISSPSDSFSSELLDSSHSLGRKLKMSLEAQSPLGFAGNEEFYESDRFGLARSKTLKEYLPFTSRLPGPVYGETGGFRSSQSYYPDVDLSSVSIEPHYTSPPVVHGTAPWTHRKRSGTPGDFEHIEYGVPGTHSPVSTLSSGKYFPRIPGSYANLDTGVYQAYDPQFRAKSSISYIPSFDIIPPATGRERKAVYLEQWPGQ